MRASHIPRITGDFKMNVIKHINRGAIWTLTIIILGYKVKFYTNENYTNYLSLRKLDLASRRHIHKNLLCTFHVFLSNLYNYLGKNISCFVTTKKTKISMGISLYIAKFCILNCLLAVQLYIPCRELLAIYWGP